MLRGLHFLLTYTCLYECDHCFLFCSPRARGTFTLDQLEDAMQQGVDAGISDIYLEGGEPFLYYPLVLEALRLAKRLGLSRSMVTNGYWAHSERDARLWLAPLVEIGLDTLSISNDTFHAEDPASSPASIALRAAQELGLPVGEICIEPPAPSGSAPVTNDTGAVVGGDVLLRGRAADRLVDGLPRSHASRFDECPHEELKTPGRVHLDPFGNVLVCQGVSIGNIWRAPLRKVVAAYRPEEHPIVGPLIRGGPVELARRYGLPVDDGWVDHCHLCFAVRRQLAARFPEQLCPSQVYGED